MNLFDALFLAMRASQGREAMKNTARTYLVVAIIVVILLAICYFKGPSGNNINIVL